MMTLDGYVDCRASWNLKMVEQFLKEGVTADHGELVEKIVSFGVLRTCCTKDIHERIKHIQGNPVMLEEL
jgi:hypothetical protein